MRLDVYRQKENLSDRVAIARFGSALALRFDDVGYFNRVYCADNAVFEVLAHLEEFYRGTPFGFEIVGPPHAGDEAAHAISQRVGWRPSTRFAWIHADLNTLPQAPVCSFDIRSPEPSERERFLLTYLEGFEVAEDRMPAAIRNMRHLFDRSDLEFFLAFHEGRPAGTGMIRYNNGIALLCAGAALPEFRRNGCHAALLEARLRRARERGCQEVYSWAVLDGRSHLNMLKAGLETVGVTTCWHWTPESPS
jgi:GNAT superfamily N-acetyltransferase